jgi:hypothetical protein
VNDAIRLRPIVRFVVVRGDPLNAHHTVSEPEDLIRNHARHGHVPENINQVLDVATGEFRRVVSDFHLEHVSPCVACALSSGFNRPPCSLYVTGDHY